MDSVRMTASLYGRNLLQIVSRRKRVIEKSNVKSNCSSKMWQQLCVCRWLVHWNRRISCDVRLFVCQIFLLGSLNVLPAFHQKSNIYVCPRECFPLFLIVFHEMAMLKCSLPIRDKRSETRIFVAFWRVRRVCLWMLRLNFNVLP